MSSVSEDCANSWRAGDHGRRNPSQVKEQLYGPVRFKSLIEECSGILDVEARSTLTTTTFPMPRSIGGAGGRVLLLPRPDAEHSSIRLLNRTGP